MGLSVICQSIDGERQKLHRNRSAINHALTKGMVSNRFGLIKANGEFYFANENFLKKTIKLNSI